MSKQSIESLRELHCKSFCNFNISENVEECKKKCLCKTENIENINSLNGVKCADTSIPQGILSAHLNNYQVVKSQPKPKLKPLKTAPKVLKEKIKVSKKT